MQFCVKSFSIPIFTLFPVFLAIQQTYSYYTDQMFSRGIEQIFRLRKVLLMKYT